MPTAADYFEKLRHEWKETAMAAVCPNCERERKTGDLISVDKAVEVGNECFLCGYGKAPDLESRGVSSGRLGAKLQLVEVSKDGAHRGD